VSISIVRNLLKSINLMLRSNLLSELKTTSAGKQFHGATTLSIDKEMFPYTVTAFVLVSSGDCDWVKVRVKKIIMTLFLH